MEANWARLDAVATIPTMETRKINGADAPARPTMRPVVKKRLNAGAIWATPGMMTPNRPSWPRSSESPSDAWETDVSIRGDGSEGVLGVAVTAGPFRAV